MCLPRVARGRRLFDADPAFAKATKSNLEAIVKICGSWNDGAGMPQGYTYLGQFLAHDIVSREFPRVPTSHRSRSLDLDSVYGAGARFDQHGRFLHAVATPRFTQDLLRDPRTRQACIPEFRNDEHPIISQLHLTIQLFHNAVLEAIQKSGEGRRLDVLRQFAFAQKYVIASVQRIYIEDYLQRCCDRRIYRQHIVGRLDVFDIPAGEAQLPFEITHAALRFGHAQVRERYLLNRGEVETPLRDLFALSGQLSGTNFEGIPHDKAVDWRRFFLWDDSHDGIKAVSGRRINPKIATDMSILRELPIPDIVERNIDAGIRTELPSAQTIARTLAAMNIDERISPTIRLQRADKAQEGALRSHGLWDATPLWLFILIEAAALGDDGMRLGPLGSVFLCETIRSALQGQEAYAEVQSYCENEFGLQQIATFRDLAKFAAPGIYGDQRALPPTSKTSL